MTEQAAGLTVAMIQVFSAQAGIDALSDLPQTDRQIVAVLPEYCLVNARDLDRVAEITRTRDMEVITAMVLNDDHGTPRNSALSVRNGAWVRLYNKRVGDRTSFSEDASQPNCRAFAFQTGRLYAVTVCADRQYVAEIEPMPSVWLIPAADVTTQGVSSPPHGYRGHVFFVNGAENAPQPSYYLRADPSQTPPFASTIMARGAGTLLIEIPPQDVGRQSSVRGR